MQVKCVLKDRDSIDMAFIDVPAEITKVNIINELKNREHIGDGRVAA